MLVVTCLQKFRDNNNNIIGYLLQDNEGYTREIEAEKLKYYIREGKIDVTNLLLTSDNRLVNKSEVQINNDKETLKSENKMLLKLKVLGYNIEKIESQRDMYRQDTYSCRCYVAYRNDTDIILYIPDDLKVNNNYLILTISNKIKRKIESFKIIGGKYITDMNYVFHSCVIKNLNLSSLNTENTKTMKCMFNDCETTELNLTNFDTSKVEDMTEMFYDCKTNLLDVSNFKNNSVKYMNGMFKSADIKNIKLSDFKTNNVINMCEMFRECSADKLELLSFKTENVIDMASMFQQCKARQINISSFNTKHVIDMNGMFSACKINNFDISSFNTSSVTNMSFMFSSFETSYLDLSNFSTESVEDFRLMFSYCNADLLDISSFVITEEANLNGMFWNSGVKKIKVRDPRIIKQLQEDKFKGQIVRC